MATILEHSRWLNEMTRHWVEAGIVTPEQARAILADESEALEPATRGISLATELLAYLGIVLLSAGGVFVVTRLWNDLGGPGRVLIGLLVAAVGMGAGAFMSRVAGDGAARLRGLLLLGGTAGVALTAGVLAVEMGSDDPGVTGLAASLAAAVVSVPLWRNLDRPLQFLSSVAALGIAVGTSIDVLELHVTSTEGGLLVMAAGTAIGLGGYFDRLQPRLFALLVGGVAAIQGGLVVGGDHFLVGITLAIAAAAAMITAGLVTRAVPLEVVGVVGFLISLLTLLGHYVNNAASGVVVLLLGALVVGAAVVTNVRHTGLRH